MRLTRSFFRSAARALALALLCGPCAPRASAADPPPSAQSDAGKPVTLLSPGVEAKLKDFIDKTKVEKIKVWDARMTKEIEKIAKVTGLGDDGSKALEAPAKQAVATAIEVWQVKSTEMMRKELMVMPPDQANMMLDQRLPQITAFAQADWITDITLPFDEDNWIKALHQTLTPDQMAAWDKEESDRKQAIEKQIGDLLKNGADRIRQQQTQQILSECSVIELAVGLSKDRSSKLEDLAKSVTDRTSEMWRKRVDQMLLLMEDDQRLQFTSNGNIFIGPEEDESPVQQTEWKDGLAHFLTADEMTRLKAAREAAKTKRVHIMGQMMIVLLDEKIAFTDVQRQRLQPIADRLVKNVPELFPADDGDMNNNCSAGIFLAAAGKATDAELKPILDEIQLKRWRHISDDGSAPPDASDGKEKPEENAEPEDIEKAIALFLYQKSENERKRILNANVLKAEDAVRVAGLSAESSDRLQAAARGATEESLASWKWFTEQQVRSQLQEVTPENVKQRLDSLEDYMFFQRAFGQFNRQSIWDETVKGELNAKQQDAWKKETDARSAFRDQTIASLVLSRFERSNQISPDQWEKLEPMVAKVAHDYSQDIEQIFSPNNPVPWYMQGPYALLPIAGLSDTDLKTVLSKEQLDRWHGSPECGGISGLWQNIQQMHTQRANVNVR